MMQYEIPIIGKKISTIAFCKKGETRSRRFAYQDAADTLFQPRASVAVFTHTHQLSQHYFTIVNLL